MAKDPAFLFYSKDWLEGTAEMHPSEKGVYIDLLCHQHQKGDLPASTERLARIVGLPHDSFMQIWGELSKKFEPIDEPNGEPNATRIANKKLSTVMGERSEKGKRNRISGTFAAVLKKADLSKKQYNEVRSMFKIEEFEHIDTERLTECLTEWLGKCLKSIANGNGNANEDINNNKVESSEIQNTHPLQISISENLKNVSKMKTQLTEDDCIRLLNKYDKSKVWQTLQAMDNYVGIEKKYNSVNLTLRNWIEMSTKQTQKSEPGLAPLKD